MHFNPRTPVGCDVSKSVVPPNVSRISIHAPQWGATSHRFCRFDREAFQSTHPSGVRPCVRTNAAYIDISIHAPQWGATARHMPTFARPDISIHAPQWGATVPPTATRWLLSISIHAPQWGATQPCRHRAPRDGISIHAPQWGATFRHQTCRPFMEFQSTHPSGVRLGGLGVQFAQMIISIHAPQWGATTSAEPSPMT